ncbi:MAG: sugar transferase [Opitutaceae bacterium]
MSLPLFNVRDEALPAWKRALDVSCCMVALPFLALGTFWAFLITTIAARGPIFFRQERVGYRGRRFLLYKFRTMHVTASAAPHQAHFSHLMTSNVPMQKLDARGDTRLIPGGWLLRASGFDELPQVINVLKGEMSIVGPRPCIPYEYERYSEAQRDRLNSVPGLTGLWQVSGKNRTTFDEMVRLDIAYAQRRSLLTDLWIILRTLPALWTQISDTRSARSAAAKAGAAVSTPGREAVRSPESATFVARSQNVIAGTRVEEHKKVTTRQSRQSCVSFRTRSESAAAAPRDDLSSDRN